MKLTEGKIFKTLFIYSLPLILTNVVQLLFHAADVTVLGIMVDDNAVAAVGALYFLKVAQNKPFYDQYIGKNLKGLNPGFAMGVVGAGAAVLQFVLLLFTSLKETIEYPFYGEVTIKMSVSVPWLTWLALVVFAALAAVDFLVVNKKEA